MKKTIFIISLILIVYHTVMIDNCNSQWILQYTGTTADLSHIKFLNKNTGWACGAGVILKTTNSGTNWTVLNLPVIKPMQKIQPIDSNVIYSVGMFETIIKSSDGGSNWQVIRDGTFGTGNSYFSCFFINQNTGWISGGPNRKILKTVNGCKSFDSIVTTTPGNISDIYFIDSLKGLYCDDNGSVRKTTNGGYNWFTINIPVGTYEYDFRNFTFVNNFTGWVITYSGHIFKTNDFGSNWDSISIISNSGYPLHNIFFTNINTGYTGGAGYFLYRSTNGGYNWIQDYNAYPLNAATSIYFVNDSTGWKVTNGGRICYTTNGGQLVNITNNNTTNDLIFKLKQNYPNPFNIQTTIEFNITTSGIYQLDIFDLRGREIETLFNKQFNQGKYSYTYIAGNLSSGIYFYRLKFDKVIVVKSFILIK